VSPLAPHAPPCACHRTGSLGERLSTDLREVTVSEWVQIGLAAGALYLSWRIYKEVKS
jgi:hypothetical protein